MNKLFSLAIVSLCITGILLVNCSDKSSNEACRFQTTMDLDRGNYDAVLASPCADSMQIGAAWFGKAGFDMKDVINRFSETGSTGSSGTNSDLNVFMNSLVGAVDGSTFTSLDNAASSYTLVTASTVATSDIFKDAKFYISLVDAIKGLSLIKVTIQDPDGLLDTSCDLNANTRSDEVDATICALLYSVDTATVCSFASTTGVTTTAAYITTPTFTIFKLVNGATSTIPYPNIFTAMTITTGTGASAACGQYTKLLYNDSASSTGLSVATVTEDRCNGTAVNPTDGSTLWPCPIDNADYLNFVTALDASLNASVDSMNSALISSGTGTTTDVQQSINDIKAQNCCVNEGVGAWNPDDPSSCACSPEELAAYLQTI